MSDSVMSVQLFYKDDRSDKEYRMQVVPQGTGFHVLFQFGRRGGTLQQGSKTKAPVSEAEAKKIFFDILREKESKQYKQAKNGKATAAPAAPSNPGNGRSPYPAELLMDVVDAKERAALLLSERHIMQAKADGHRRQIAKTISGEYIGYKRSGEAVGIAQELIGELKQVQATSFFMDGELIGDRLEVWDLLEENGKSLATEPYGHRFARLCSLVNALVEPKFLFVVPTWTSPQRKKIGYAACVDLRAEGVVFKLITAPYKAGVGWHKRDKFVKSISAKVTAVRDDGKESAALALLDGKKWVDVGRASLIGKGPIEVGNIVEVLFLYATEDSRLYQPRIKCVRTDIGVKNCTISQLKHLYKGGISGSTV